MNNGDDILRKQMVVYSDKPEGPYSKPAFIEEDGIDPSLFTDKDGRRYMLLNRGARMFEVSADATEKIGEAELIYYGDNKRAPEGPHLLMKDGYYYLFLAEGGTGLGHCITVARSKHVKGPYEACPYNPIMTQRKSLEKIQRSGHGKPVQTQNGEWYMVYLCGRPVGDGYCILGRETSMDPITWTPDGWPIINNNKGPSVLQYKPNLPECKWEETTYDHFEGEKLGLDWMFVRNADIESYEVANSHLRIYGSQKDLNNKEAKNVIVRRQKHHHFEAEAKFVFHGTQNEQEAGMTCYYDTLTYIKFGILYRDGETFIRVVERIGDKENIHFEQPVMTIDAAYLKVVTHCFERKFYFSYDGEQWMELGTLDNVYYLSDEGEKGARFTGSMVGMYVVSGIHEERAYADFDYFNYQEIK